jgi:hypothetical protein
MTKKPEKVTLSIGFQERERLQQLAAHLGIKAKSGPGAHSSGSITGFAEALDAAYATNNARVLTLLARALHGERPDVFGYLLHGNMQLLVRWTANHPASKGGEPVMLIPGSQDRPQRGGDINGAQLRVPTVVTEDDLRWLTQGAFHVQREGTVQQQDEVVLV